MESQSKLTKQAIVIEANKGFCLISSSDCCNVIRARLKSSLYKKNATVVCGDIVSFEMIDDNEEVDAVIVSIKKRTNILKRPTIANIDTCFLVLSIKEPVFNYLFASKALLFLQLENIFPEIVLTKSDLDENYKKVKSDFEKENYIVHAVSIKNKKSYNGLQRKNSSVFIGRSGVGKTTIMNELLNSNFKTKEISQKLGRGKHTTTGVKGVRHEEGIIFDTPGFETIHFKKITRREVASSFFNPAFLNELNCHYTSCDHLAKSNCNLLKLEQLNKVSKERVEMYKKVLEISSTTKW